MKTFRSGNLPKTKKDNDWGKIHMSMVGYSFLVVNKHKKKELYRIIVSSHGKFCHCSNLTTLAIQGLHAGGGSNGKSNP